MLERNGTSFIFHLLIFPSFCCFIIFFLLLLKRKTLQIQINETTKTTAREKGNLPQNAKTKSGIKQQQQQELNNTKKKVGITNIFIKLLFRKQN